MTRPPRSWRQRRRRARRAAEPEADPASLQARLAEVYRALRAGELDVIEAYFTLGELAQEKMRTELVARHRAPR